MTVRYCAKRLLRAAISLFIIVTLVFIFMRFMPVEGYFDTSYDLMSEQQIANVLAKLGLDKPLHVQLFKFYRQLFHGDLGVSNRYRTDYPVARLISQKMPISFLFGMTAVLIGMPLGVALGVVMARYKRRLPDKLGTAYVVIIQMIPAAVYYIVIQMTGSELLGVGMLYRRGDVSTMLLPVFSLALPSIAHYALWIKRFMIDTYHENYILAARAKGASELRIAFCHVLKNAALPMLQQLPGVLMGTLCGSLYIESLYSIPGMGGLLVDAIMMQDNGLTQGCVLVFAAMGVLSMLAGDILVALLDPRVKFERNSNTL